MATPTKVFGGPIRGTGAPAAAYDVVFSSSYATGGEALTLATLGWAAADVAFALAVVKVAGANGPVHVFYDIGTEKLLAYSATAQVANATDLSAVTARVHVFAR